MIKNCRALLLLTLLFNLSVGQSALAQSADANNSRPADEIKAKIEKIGAGDKSKIKLELLDKTKLKGTISLIEADSFTLKDKKTGVNTQIAYSQVKKVSREGMALSSKITLGALAAGAAVVLIIYLQIYCNEQGC